MNLPSCVVTAYGTVLKHNVAPYLFLLILFLPIHRCKFNIYFCYLLQDTPPADIIFVYNSGDNCLSVTWPEPADNATTDYSIYYYKEARLQSLLTKQSLLGVQKSVGRDFQKEKYRTGNQQFLNSSCISMKNLTNYDLPLKQKK